MHALVFYFGAVLLYALGALCIHHTSPYTRTGGDIYIKRDRRRLIGKTLFVLGTICLIIGLMVQGIDTSP